MVFVVLVPIPIPFPIPMSRFQCRGLQMANSTEQVPQFQSDDVNSFCP